MSSNENLRQNSGSSEEALVDIISSTVNAEDKTKFNTERGRKQLRKRFHCLRTICMVLFEFGHELACECYFDETQKKAPQFAVQLQMD